MIDFVQLARQSGYLCFDIEFDARKTHVFAPGFTAHGCGFSSFDGENIVTDYITDVSQIQYIVENTFGTDIQIVAHNAKFDINCLKRMGLEFPDPQLRCTMIALNLLDDNLDGSELGLKPTVLREYSHKMEEYADAASDGLDSQRFLKYANEDVYWELRLFKDLEPLLKPFWRLYTEVIMPSTLVFSDMECFGMPWDVVRSEDFYAKLFKARERLSEKIQQKIGRINLESNPQLSKRLFRELGYDTRYTELGKSGDYSIDASVLDQMASKYPVCNQIRAYRSCQKLISTYLEPAYSQIIQNHDKRIHSSYWLVSQTGRTRCSDLNNQNLPVRVGSDLGDLASIFDDVKIRKCVKPPAGKKLIVCDANQVELRLAGHIMGEPEFINAYCDWTCFSCGDSGSDKKILHKCPTCGQAENKKAFAQKSGFWQGRDLHTEVLEKLPPRIASKLTRDHGKVLNFAIIYNASEWRLHYEHPQLSPDEWRTALDAIMADRKYAKKYHEISERLLRTQGWRDTIFGRRRRIPKSEYAPKGIFDKKKFKHALNQFINAPIQSAGADLGHVSLVKLRREFKSTGDWGTRVKLINWVHDECVLECDEDITKDTLNRTIEILESAVTLDVPIRWEGAIYDDWSEAK